MAQRIGNQSGQMAENDRHPFHYTLRMLVIYSALTFAITWAIRIPAVSTVPEDRLILFIIPAAFGPFLSAAITILTNTGWTELRQWLRQVFTLRIPVILYLPGVFFLPIAVGVLQYGLYRVLGENQTSPPRYRGTSIFSTFCRQPS